LALPGALARIDRLAIEPGQHLWKRSTLPPPPSEAAHLA
jgi:hypothetical protein